MKTKLAEIGFYFLYGVFYAGFLFQKSYSLKYSLFLVVLFIGFFKPIMIRFLVRKFGVKRILFTALPSAVGIILIYVIVSHFYYYLQVHPFDPYLQIPPPDAPESFYKPKSANSFRILTLGGSTTRNARIPVVERFPSVVAFLLKDRYPESDIEIFNAGMDWYTTKHSMINYVTNMRDWKPDIVIIMHAINDLYRSFSPGRYAIGQYNRTWSHFYGPSINGARPPTFEQYLFSELIFRWWSVVREVEGDIPLNRYVALKDYKRYMSSLIHYLKQDDVQILVMTQPYLYKEEMSDEESSTLWIGREFCYQNINLLQREFASVNSLKGAMEAFNAAAKKIGQTGEVAVVDLEHSIARNLTNFMDDVHCSGEGNKLIASHIVDKIIQQGMLVNLAPSEMLPVTKN